MESFGGHERICAVVSDSAASCVTARRIYTEKFEGIVGVNDQAHIADLLSEDIGGIAWVRKVLDQINGVCSYIHTHRTIKKIYKNVMGLYNAKVYAMNAELTHDFGEEVEVTQLRREEEMQRRMEKNLADDLNSASDERVMIVKTAVMLKRPSNTRFASHESVVEAFLRSIRVLRALVSHDRFIAHFENKTSEEKRKRDEKFVAPIMDNELVRQARVVLEHLTIVRKYLRLFDADEARIWEVAPLTRTLETRLATIPYTEWYTKDKKEEMMVTLRNRRDKSPMSRVRVPLIEGIHIVALMLDPINAPSNYTDFIPYMRDHAERFAIGLAGIIPTEYGRTIVRTYQEQMNIWIASRESDSGMKYLQEFNGEPLEWWKGGNAKSRVLTDFAIRTLNVSPTAMAVDRSFSAQKRIHTPLRNRLGQEKVNSLMFCRMNLLLLKSQDNASKEVLKQSLLQARCIAHDLSALEANSYSGDENDDEEEESLDDLLSMSEGDED